MDLSWHSRYQNVEVEEEEEEDEGGGGVQPELCTCICVCVCWVVCDAVQQARGRRRKGEVHTPWAMHTMCVILVQQLAVWPSMAAPLAAAVHHTPHRYVFDAFDPLQQVPGDILSISTAHVAVDFGKGCCCRPSVYMGMFCDTSG